MLVENASLRESLSTIQKEVVGLLSEQHSRRHKKLLAEGKGAEGEGAEGEGAEGKGTEGTGDFGGLSSGHFQMPYDIVRDGERQSTSLHTYCTKM